MCVQEIFKRTGRDTADARIVRRSVEQRDDKLKRLGTAALDCRHDGVPGFPHLFRLTDL